MDLPDLLEIRRINTLPFHDPIARVIHHERGDVIIRTIPWCMHFALMRRLRAMQNGIGYGDFGRDDDF